ncbi:MAG: hypothetical protein MJZ00_07045 [Paludibacteraceae bacterium]|nr:hypothetical protein [Paludibacteraceae bacterium]
MEDTYDENLIFLIKNKTSQSLNLDVKYEIPSWSEHCFNVYIDSLKTDSIYIVNGFGFIDEPKSPFDFFMTECIKKQIVIMTLSGDTLANWNDSSVVFDPKYWLIESQKDGDIHCTLQLTDEVLELK